MRIALFFLTGVAVAAALAMDPGTWVLVGMFRV